MGMLAAATLVTINLAIAALALTERGAALDQSRADTGAVGRLILKAAEERIADADRLLVAAAEQWTAAGTTPGRGGLPQRLERLERLVPAVRSVAIIDPQGAILAGTHADGPFAGLDMARHPAFRQHRAQPDGGLLLSGLPNGPVDASAAVLASRRLSDREGRFGGIVVALLPADQLAAAVRADARRLVSGARIRLDDGSVTASFGDDALAPPEPADARRDPDAASGRPSPFDGVVPDGEDRLVTLHRSRSFPLAVVAWTDRAAALGAWGDRLGLHVAMAVIASGCATLALWSMARHTRRLHRTVAALDEARMAAERANRAKSEFLANMAHELRPPLNTILGFGQLLLGGRKEPLSERQADHVRQIIRGGDQLLGLVNDINDLSRSEAARLTVAPAEFAAEDLLDDVQVMAARMAEEAAVSVTVDAEAARGAAVHADYTRAKQCLFNLVRNAIAFNRPQGSVRITAEAVENGVRFTVSDTGRGIPAVRMGELFRPFSRLGVGAAGVEGSGIGLALTKSLAELMKGRVGVESTEGQGSRFWIELPRVRSAAGIRALGGTAPGRASPGADRAVRTGVGPSRTTRSGLFGTGWVWRTLNSPRWS